MDILKKIFNLVSLLAVIFLLSSCQFGYFIKSGYNQMSLLHQRVPIDEALNDAKLSDTDKAKLKLAQKAREFAQVELHLKNTKNYTSFVQLDRPYVTYVVSAAPRWELQHHYFSYPFIGKMPYKGYFNEKDARELKAELEEENLDTYMRGVSAFSTLGWFNDPILSSMLRYKDHDLVNTIIHETVHATLFIKHEADFNERMAVFLGNKGTELFYLKEEGPNSKTLQQIRLENADENIFSQFIGGELLQLETWYKQLPADKHNEAERRQVFKDIQERFKKNILPLMKTDSYKSFAETELNNAKLLVYKTYVQDLNDFATLYQLSNQQFSTFIENCQSLQNEENPSQALKQLNLRLAQSQHN